MTHTQFWHLGALHDNWRFIRGSPRTCRQAFGSDFVPDGHRSTDTWLAVIVVLGAVVAFIFIQHT